MNQQNQKLILIDNQTYRVNELTEFGFTVENQLDLGSKGKGELVFGDKKLAVEFRVRSCEGSESACTFANLSIADQETIRKYLASLARVGAIGDLENRTYDELAQGIISSSPATTSDAPKGNGAASTLVMALLFFAFIGLIILASVFLRARSSLTVSNSALVGNYLPINAKAEGEITEVLVNAGDFVQKGDVLLRLSNQLLHEETMQFAAQARTAEAKANALRRQIAAFDERLKIASKKLDLDLEVARSELTSAEQDRMSTLAAYDRMKPFVGGAITELELDEVETLMLAKDSLVVAKQNQVKQIEFSQVAAKSNILILGDRIDDEMGRLRAELEIAEAELVELSRFHELSKKRSKALEIVAPRDGHVYVAYRQVGEFVKVADELIALSYPGKSWAAGQVLNTQASRVLPGQPVKISIPSLKMKLDGVVMSVGHRAMYSKGHYTAEFRGAAATDVPVKVFIADLPENIPSGLRLNMAINTGFGIEWLDESLGYELKQLGTTESSAKKATPPSTTDVVAVNSIGKQNN